MVSDLANCYIAVAAIRDFALIVSMEKAIMTTVGKGTATSAAGEAPNALHEDVESFSGHCAYIRSVYVLAARIWRDSNDDERKMMEGTAPSFFLDLGQVLAEYLILAACRITDPADDGRNENFTIAMFVDSFPANSPTSKQLDELARQMDGLRKKILPARNKLVAHADREAIRQGKALGQASWKEWDEFWTALKKLVHILNENTLGTPYEIDIAGVHGDAEMLLKSLQQSQYFETLLKGGDQAVKRACLKVAAPTD